MIRRQQASYWTNSEVLKLLQLLQEQQADAAAMLDSVPMALAMVQADGTILGVNQQFVTLFALDREKLPTNLLRFLNHDEFAAAVANTAAGSGSPKQFTLPNPHDQGQVLRCSLSSRKRRPAEVLVALDVLPVVGSAPAPLEAEVAAPDIVSAPVAEPIAPPVPEQEPGKPVVETRRAVDALVLVLDFDGRVVRAEGPLELLSRPAAALPGTPIVQLVSDADRLRVLEWLSDLMHGAPATKLTASLRTQNTLIPVTLLPAVIAEDGRPVSVEITVLERESVDVFPRVQDAVGRFSAGAGQELRGQLEAVLAYTDALLARYAPYEALREELEQVKRAAEGANHFVGSMLYAGSVDPNTPETINLSYTLNQIETLLRALAGSTVPITFRVEPNLGMARIHHFALERALVSLVNFARDSMPDGGEVLLTARRVDEAAELSISMPGTLDDAEAEHLFEPFYVTSTGRNFGMGLSEARGILLQAGGTLEWKRSRTGLSFHLSLPLVHVEEIAPLHATAPEERLRWLSRRVPTLPRQKVVLLVDDDQMVRSVVRGFLEQGGYEVVDAPGGTEAVNAALRYPGQIDVLLVDTELQGVDGYEAARTLREMRPETKVVFMTSQTSTSDSSQAQDAQHLSKPFTPKTLLGKLEDVLREEPPRAAEYTVSAH